MRPGAGGSWLLLISTLTIACSDYPAEPARPKASVAGNWKGSPPGFTIALRLGTGGSVFGDRIGDGTVTRADTNESQFVLVDLSNLFGGSSLSGSLNLPGTGGYATVWVWVRGTRTDETTITGYLLATGGLEAGRKFIGGDSLAFVLRRQ